MNNSLLMGRYPLASLAGLMLGDSHEHHTEAGTTVGHGGLGPRQIHRAGAKARAKASRRERIKQKRKS